MLSMKKPIYHVEQIRELERLAEEQYSISGQVMMQRAAKAAYDYLLHRWPKARHITLMCGAGNNGGDGYVLAHLLQERGLPTTIWQIGDHSKLKNAAKLAHDGCQKLGVATHAFNDKADFHHPDLIIDAIYGIGLHDKLRDEALRAIQKMEQSACPIFSLDIPSGVDANTGQVLGTAVRATATITFIGLKLGLLTGSGIAYTGELIANDLQLPTELLSSIPPVAEKICFNAFASYLKPRFRDWHKGLSGHVLIIGGDKGFSGSVRMAGEAALRVGAGLVTIATHPEHAHVLNVCRPELMCRGITEPRELDILLEKASVIILGPGLGRSSWSTGLWLRAMQAKQPMVVDADGLNLLAEQSGNRSHWVLTPHPGEAGRLLKQTTETVQQDRLMAANHIQKQYGGVCVLKGAGSLVVAPSALPAICDLGNPGMASAGMGDVLSGVIGGLIAQGIPLADAASLGVCMHAMAGDLAAKEGQRGLLAMDLMPHLHHLSNENEFK